MTKLNDLINKIDAEKNRPNEVLNNLESSLETQVHKILEDDKILQDAIQEVESSTELGADESGIYRWIRFDCNDIEGLSSHKYINDIVDTYLSEEHCIHVQRDHDAFVMYEGECILVVSSYRDGRYLYDQELQKSFADLTSDSTDSDIKALIDEYQESSGVFGSIISVDDHDNYHYWKAE